MTEYVKVAMRVVWKSNSGKQHVRTVSLGHVRRTGTNFEALAVLNIGNRGDVISFEVFFYD